MLHRRCDAGPTGLEPATSALTGRRSNQTELRSQNRGPKQDRTADLLNAIQALYQLSYGPVLFQTEYKHRACADFVQDLQGRCGKLT